MGEKEFSVKPSFWLAKVLTLYQAYSIILHIWMQQTHTNVIPIWKRHGCFIIHRYNSVCGYFSPEMPMWSSLSFWWEKHLLRIQPFSLDYTRILHTAAGLRNREEANWLDTKDGSPPPLGWDAESGWSHSKRAASSAIGQCLRLSSCLLTGLNLLCHWLADYIRQMVESLSAHLRWARKLSHTFILRLKSAFRWKGLRKGLVHQKHLTLCIHPCSPYLLPHKI